MRISRIDATPLAIPLAAGVPLGERRAARREPRPLLRPHRGRRRRLRRDGLRGAGRGRRGRPADRAAAHRPLGRRRRGDPALGLDGGPLEDDAAVHGVHRRRHRGGLLGRARPHARRAVAAVLRRAGAGGARLLRVPAGRRRRDARAHARELAGHERLLPEGRAAAGRRRDRRRRARRDRAGAAPPHRPERGVGRSDRGRADPAARGARPRLGRAARCRTGTSPGSRTCGERSTSRSPPTRPSTRRGSFVRCSRPEAADVVVQGPHDAGGLLPFRRQASHVRGVGAEREPARVHAERDQLPRACAGRVDRAEPDEREPDDAPAARGAADDRRRRRDAAAASTC